MSYKVYIVFYRERKQGNKKLFTFETAVTARTAKEARELVKEETKQNGFVISKIVREDKTYLYV